MTPTQRVADGARMLDEKQPDWFTMVDLGTLNIGSISDCVGSQIERHLRGGEYRLGMFNDFLDRYGLPAADAPRYGFDVATQIALAAPQEFVDLRLAWTDEITKRQMGMAV